ncbi:MAG: hypothetical protein F6K65_38490 [Moorea sp. SIO3C2]|nr:hypothetical protein [Moorena sp. SIO3C2]
MRIALERTKSVSSGIAIAISVKTELCPPVSPDTLDIDTLRIEYPSMTITRSLGRLVCQYGIG